MMYTKRQVMQAVVGLIEVNDFGLLSQRPVVDELVQPIDFDLVQRIARIIKTIYDDFDYTESPEFLSSVEGKSEKFVEMKKRLLMDPNKKPAQLNRLAEALVELPDTTTLLGLVPQWRSEEVENLAQLVCALHNPDQ